MQKVFTVVVITTTLSVLDSEHDAANTINNSTTPPVIEIPVACCLTHPYSCEVTEDMAFLAQVALALSNIAESRLTARWYATHSGGDSLQMLINDAKSRQTMGLSFNNITALAIAEENANGKKLRPACTDGTECKAAPRPPGCAVQSIDAVCRWRALTKGSMDGTIRAAMAVLAEVDVSREEMEASADDLQLIADALQLGLVSVEAETWLRQAWHAGYAAARPMYDEMLSFGAAFVIKAWDDIGVPAVSAGVELCCSVARIVGDISTRLAEEPSAVDFASRSLDLMGEKLALAANGSSDAIAYIRDAVWAAYQAAHKKFSRATTAATSTAPAGAKEQEVEEMGQGTAAAGGFFARRIVEAIVPRRLLSGPKSATKAGERAPARVVESFRTLLQQAQEDAPPAGTIAHQLLYDAWV